jgi:hypothetical protein
MTPAIKQPQTYDLHSTATGISLEKLFITVKPELNVFIQNSTLIIPNELMQKNSVCFLLSFLPT